MMSKKRLIMMFLAVVLFLGFLKFFEMQYYLISKEEIVKYNNTINKLKKVDIVKVDNYIDDGAKKLIFKKLIINSSNLFSNFLIASENEEYYEYILPVDDLKYSSYRAKFIIKYNDSIISDLKNNKNTYKKITNKMIDTFLKKYNLKSDIDLINFIKDYDTLSINAFDSILIMQEKNIIKYILKTYFDNIDSISILSGRYNGYIKKYSTGMCNISIIDGNKVYFLVLDSYYYFNDSFIETLLKNIFLNNN